MKSKLLFEALITSLKNPKSLIHIDLSEQLLEDSDVFLLIEALKGNAFIQSIDLSHNPKLSEKSLLSLMSHLSGLNGLIRLRLSGLQLTDNTLIALGTALQTCKTLQVLDLSNNPMTEMALKGLGKGLSHQPLRALYLKNCTLNAASKALAPFLLACPNSLQILVLAQNKLNSKVAAWLQPALARFIDLRELDISENLELGSAGAESIAEAATDLPHLAVLNLNQVALNGGLEAFFEALKERPNLRSLSLAGNQLGKGDALHLQKYLPRYPGLVHLDLGNNGELIEGNGSLIFAESLVKITHLQELNLSDTGCTINLHSLMSYVKNLRQLTILNLSHAKLGYSMDLPQLSALLQALPHCSNLRWLNLSFNGLREAAGVALGQALCNQAGLESLDLTGNPLGSAGVHELLKGLKGHPTLQRLSLANTGLTVLSEVESLMALKNLNLNKNPLKPESISILGKLLNTTTTLQQLDLSSNTFNKTELMTFIQEGLAHNHSLLSLVLDGALLDTDTANRLKTVFIQHPTLQQILLKNPGLAVWMNEFEALNAQKQRIAKNLYYEIDNGSLTQRSSLLTEILPEHLQYEIGEYSETALHHAARNGKKEVFQSVLNLYQQHRVPFNIRNALGQMAQDILLRQGQSSLLSLLETALRMPPKTIFFEERPKALDSLSDKLKYLADKGLSKWINQEELDLYISIKGALQLSERQGFDLEGALQKFCSHEQQKVLLLLGASGSGKTLFFQYFASRFNKDYQPGAPLALYIPLLAVSQKVLENPEQITLVEETLYQKGFKPEEIQALKRQQTFLLLLDAYDEPRLEENLYITHRLGEWQGKVIISCRTDYLGQLPSYQSYFAPAEKGGALQFNLLQEIYALPFSPEQVQDYITKYLTVRLKEEAIKNELLRWGEEWLKPEKYQHYMTRIPGLSQLMENPFLLRIAVEILPEVAKTFDTPTEKETQRILATGAKLYEIFLNRWFIRQRDKVIRSGKSIRLSPTTDYLPFAKKLASQLYNKGLSQVTYQEEVDTEGNVIENEWSYFFSDKILSTDKGNTEKEKKAACEKRVALRVGCPLRKVEIDAMQGMYQYSFLHMSLYEYFMSEILYHITPKLGMMKSAPTEKPKETGPSLLSLAATFTQEHASSSSSSSQKPVPSKVTELADKFGGFTPFWQGLGKAKRNSATTPSQPLESMTTKGKEEEVLSKSKMLQKTGSKQ